MMARARSIDEVFGLRRERRMQRDEIGFAQRFVERDELDSVLLREFVVLGWATASTRMSKPRARLATPLPMRPRPTIASVLFQASVPVTRSHRLACTLCAAA